MKQLYAAAVLFFVCLCNYISAQAPNWLWAKSAEGAGNVSLGYGIRALPNSIFYFTGGFKSPGIVIDTSTLYNNDIENIITARYDSSGNLIWVRDATSGADAVYGKGVSTDSLGNIYITGAFFSSQFMLGNYTLVNTGYQNVFTAKYDSSGNLLWATSPSGPDNDLEPLTISTDLAGNSYITGPLLSAYVIFGSDTVFNTGFENSFVAKYDAHGNVLWARGAAGPATVATYGVASDANSNCYLTGFIDTPYAVFGRDTQFTSTGGSFFITKYSTGGQVLWVRGCKGGQGGSGLQLSTDGYGNCYVTGQFESAVITFGNDSLINAGSSNVFVVKYDSSGNVIWARGIGGTKNDQGDDISTDINGYSYVSGYFTSPDLIVGNDTLVNNGLSNMFVVKYDPDGNVLWAKCAGGSKMDATTGISHDAAGNVYLTGCFSSDTVAFGPDTLYKTSAVYEYLFIAKLGSACSVANPVITLPKTTLCPNDSIEICAPPGYTSYQWNTGINSESNCIEATQAGNYYVTVTDNNGCSAQSNHINVSDYPSPNVSISEHGDTLTAFNVVTYQWYLNGEVINNATDSVYIATQSGSYTVQITDSNGCTAVSNPVTITGINNLTESNISVFPNPTNDKWQLTVDNNLLGSKLTVFDDNGKTVYESQISNLKTEINFNAASGVYLLRISGDNMSVVRKLVKL